MPQYFNLDSHKREVAVFRWRLIVAAACMLLLVGGLLLWLVNIQILDYEYYSSRSDGNRLNSQYVAPTRGLIYDQQGRLLADNRPAFSLTVVPERAGQLEESFGLLREIIDLDDQDIRQFEERRRRRAVPLSSVALRYRLSEEEIARIATHQHRLPGFAVEARLLRHYPYGQTVAHALGYVGEISREELQDMDEDRARNYRGANRIGKRGIEKTYEHYLHGEVGFETAEKNNRGQVMRVLDRTDPVPGQDLQLYLDIELQRAAEQALGDHRGAIVAIDPRTGGVLAMLSKPDFDPNLFVTGISREQLGTLNRHRFSPMFDRALSSRVPGSTIKPIIGLAGLYHDVVTPETEISDPGYYRLPGRSRPYYDWTWWVDRSGHGTVDLERAIYQSCNTYFSHVAVELGIDRIHDYLRSWGFGSNLAIDIPEAGPGLVPSPEWKRRERGQPWYPGETPPEGFGNGMFQATTLQMATAAAALANHGQMVRPRMLKGVRRGDEAFSEVIFDAEPAPQPLLPDEERVAHVRQAMEHTVSKPYDPEHRRHEGTAYPYIEAAEPLAYPMAGKSGTAQVVGVTLDASGNRTEPDQVVEEHLNHAMFIAFDASPESRIAVAVYVENGEGGSSVAGPIAREVLDAWMLPRLEEQIDPDAMLLTGPQERQ